MKRTELKRSRRLEAKTGLKRTARLRARSKKTAAQYVDRRALVAEMLEDRPRCQLNFPGCWGEATCVDEIKSRARRGSITDPANCLPACGPCNTYKEDHPAEALARGLARHAWETDETGTEAGS